MSNDVLANNSLNANSGTGAELRGDLTGEARECLRVLYLRIVEDCGMLGIQAATGLGKSFTAIKTLGNAGTEVTGDRPVVIAFPTTDAREEKALKARDCGITALELEGRHDACPVADGQHDAELSAVEGKAASDWMDEQAAKGFTFGHVHSELENRIEEELPCKAGGECDAISQWKELEEGDFDLVMATHEMARAPRLREDTNLIIDEMPQYQMGLDGELGPGRRHIRQAVTLRLQETEAPLQTWQEVVREVKSKGDSESLEQTREVIGESQKPDPDWYFNNRYAHRMDDAVLRALLGAEESVMGERYVGSTVWPPKGALPRHQKKSPGNINREEITVILGKAGRLRKIWNIPNFREARSLICLDAHPYEHRWQANIGQEIEFESLLDEVEESQWRQQERGLVTIQIGNARRPLSNGENLSERKTKALLAEVAELTDGEVNTAVAPRAVEDDIEQWLKLMVKKDVRTIHHGEEMGVDFLGDEDWGLVMGHMDPGDGDVLDYLAYHRLEAEPAKTDCQKCGDTSMPPSACDVCGPDGQVRAKGRTFGGPDADEADEILRGVTERHVLQSVGRYARNAEDETDNAVVFIWTTVVPDRYTDIEADGVLSTFNDKRQAILEELLKEDDRSKSELYNEVVDQFDSLSESTVNYHLGQLKEQGLVRKEGESVNTTWVLDTEADQLNPYGNVDIAADELLANLRTKTVSTGLCKQSRLLRRTLDTPELVKQNHLGYDPAAYQQAMYQRMKEALEQEKG